MSFTCDIIVSVNEKHLTDRYRLFYTEAVIPPCGNHSLPSMTEERRTIMQKNTVTMKENQLYITRERIVHTAPFGKNGRHF